MSILDVICYPQRMNNGLVLTEWSGRYCAFTARYIIKVTIMSEVDGSITSQSTYRMTEQEFNEIPAVLAAAWQQALKSKAEYDEKPNAARKGN